MDVLLEVDQAVTRCLWVDGDHIYVGTCHDAKGHRLHIIDKRGTPIRAWKLPLLVSDVAIAGECCYAALGPGRLATWTNRALGPRGADVEAVDANAPKLAVCGDTLFWGTSWGEIHQLARGQITAVKKWLSAIAVDGERIYAGYDDGKVRVFSRDGKRLKVLPAGTRGTRCAVRDNTLVTIDQNSGSVIVWDLPAFAERLRFTRDTGGAKWGVVGLDIFGRYIVSHTFEDVQVHDLAGTLVMSWRTPDGRLEDTWLDDTGLLVAAGARVHRIEVR